MKSALCIDLTASEAFSFEKKFLTALKASLPEIIIMDMDLKSDGLIIEYCSLLLQDSECAVILIESGGSAAPRILPVLEEIHKNFNKYLCFLQGENPWIEKMFFNGGANFIKMNLPLHEQVRIALEFFRNGPLSPS